MMLGLSRLVLNTSVMLQYLLLLWSFSWHNDDSSTRNWWNNAQSAPEHKIHHTFSNVEGSWSSYAHILLQIGITWRWDKRIGFSIFSHFTIQQWEKYPLLGEKWLSRSVHCKLKIGRGFEIQECPKAAGMVTGCADRHRATQFGF